MLRLHQDGQHSPGDSPLHHPSQTQLDSLRASPNVLVLATSNLTGSIDRAFVDRADIKQYVGLPPLTAVRYMLDTAVQVVGGGATS